MKIIAALALLCFSSPLTVAQSYPSQPGVYLSANGGWQKLSPTEVKGVKLAKLSVDSELLFPGFSTIGTADTNVIICLIESDAAVTKRQQNTFAKDTPAHMTVVRTAVTPNVGRGIRTHTNVFRQYVFRETDVVGSSVRRESLNTIVVQANSVPRGEYLLAVDSPEGVGTYLFDFNVTEGTGKISPGLSSSGTIVVYQDGALKVSVLVDGETYCVLGGNRRAYIELPPGSYKIQAQGTNRGVSDVSMQPGSKIYMKLSFTKHGLMFKEISSDKGEVEIFTKKPIEDGQIMNPRVSAK